MTFIKAKFTTADECDRALGELVAKMCVTNSEIVSFDGKSSGRSADKLSRHADCRLFECRLADRQKSYIGRLECQWRA